MSTASRLDRVYREAERISFDENSRFVLMSDCHRGVGNIGDNFLDNSYLMFAALEYYGDRRFTYIELGDGDELWENTNMKAIIQTHSHIFWQLSCFYLHGRFYMLYGNHDRVKEKRRFMKQTCERYYCDSKDDMQELFPGMEAREGLVLQEAGTGNELFLVHGHQGDLLNDTLWRLTRFLVRHVWRKLELWGTHDPTSAAKNYTKKKKTEKRLSAWAEENKVLLVAGHTHRPVLPTPGESYYLNDGSCIHPRCITALEIQDGAITLVKWCVEAGKSGHLYVGREILEGPYEIDAYFRKQSHTV
ncbi:MAG: metallophosphoesterase family protein [Lachnospiraceae bacterium]|nr:metallophosphoesterase family protein [Lachnospiraceae bacterium]